MGYYAVPIYEERECVNQIGTINILEIDNTIYPGIAMQTKTMMPDQLFMFTTNTGNPSAGTTALETRSNGLLYSSYMTQENSPVAFATGNNYRMSRPIGASISQSSFMVDDLNNKFNLYMKALGLTEPGVKTLWVRNSANGGLQVGMRSTSSGAEYAAIWSLSYSLSNYYNINNFLNPMRAVQTSNLYPNIILCIPKTANGIITPDNLWILETYCTRTEWNETTIIYGRSLRLSRNSRNGNPFYDSTLGNYDVTEYYKEDLSDDDNTYPGGGDDKNTYPDDTESGKGTFDNTNDEVDFPPMPVWDATSTGFISMWNPTITEITALYGFLWDSDISTTLKKLFLEPMDAIISLAFFPVDPTNFPEKRNVSIGHVDTDIQMYAVQKQFVDFDFGTLKIDEYYGAAWDYSPYTQASIYLPYIGTQALDIDDVMNGTLHLKYRIDLLSGMCAAMLRVDRSRDGLQAVIYTWQGNCAMQVPITAGSARDFLNSIIQLGAMAGVSLAQPLAGAIDASMHKGEENYQSPIMGNNWINPTIATFSALNVIGQKVRVQRGGRVDANAGVMSPQEAYIILNRPVSAIPRGWNEYAGYPSLKIKNLSTQKGYTEVAYIKLNGLEATSDEIMELDGMLKGGVIL